MFSGAWRTRLATDPASVSGCAERAGLHRGANVRFESRSDDGDLSQLSQLGAELARLRVDVIVLVYAGGVACEIPMTVRRGRGKLDAWRHSDV